MGWDGLPLFAYGEKISCRPKFRPLSEISALGIDIQNKLKRKKKKKKKKYGQEFGGSFEKDGDRGRTGKHQGKK